jgi:hypothetical protein
VPVRGSIPVLPEPMPPFVLSQATTPEELGSVHGGHTASVHIATLPIRTLPRWTFAVLGVAALVGVGAAIAIQLAPGQDDAASVAPAKTVRVEQIAPIDERSADLAAAISDPTPVVPPPAAAPAPTIDTNVVPPPPPVVEAPAPAPAPVAETPAPPPVVEAKPRTHTQRSVVVAHAPTLTPAAAPAHNQFVRVNLGSEMWGYVIIDGGAKTDAISKQPITPGRHKVRVIPGNADDGIEPMSCTFTVSPEKVVTMISVNLATRTARGADSCGH